MVEKKEVEHLAELARLNVTEEEASGLAQEMTDIVAYVTQVREMVDADTVVAEVPAHHNIFRPDTEPHEGGMYTDNLLREAANTKNNSISVPKIISND